jgi:hypothetical protein
MNFAVDDEDDIENSKKQIGHKRNSTMTNTIQISIVRGTRHQDELIYC